MDNTNPKELYEQYKAVVIRTNWEGEMVVPGKKYTPHSYSFEDMALRAKLHAELKKNHAKWLAENLDAGQRWNFENDHLAD